MATPGHKKIYKRIDYYLLAYKLNNTHFNTIEKLAKSFLTIKDKDSSNLFTKKGLMLRPNHIDLNRLKINDLFRKKKYKESLSSLFHIDSIKPNEHYTHKMLGKCYYNLENYTNAEKHFKKAYMLNNEDYTSSIYLGDISFRKRDYNLAILHYTNGTVIGKKKRDRAYLGLANVFSATKKPKKTLAAYKNAVKENSKNYKALFALAKQSDNFYKDKKIGYQLYKKYLQKFSGKDSIADLFIKNRLIEIKKVYFFKGEELE